MECYLVPHTMWAPTEAYQQPLVTVVRIGRDRALVRLPGGREIDVHVDNLRKTLPTPPGRRVRVLTGRHYPIKPEAGEELELFSAKSLSRSARRRDTEKGRPAS